MKKLPSIIILEIMLIIIDSILLALGILLDLDITLIAILGSLLLVLLSALVYDIYYYKRR